MLELRFKLATAPDAQSGEQACAADAILERARVLGNGNHPDIRQRERSPLLDRQVEPLQAFACCELRQNGRIAAHRSAPEHPRIGFGYEEQRQSRRIDHPLLERAIDRDPSGYPVRLAVYNENYCFRESRIGLIGPRRDQ